MVSSKRLTKVEERYLMILKEKQALNKDREAFVKLVHTKIFPSFYGIQS